MISNVTATVLVSVFTSSVLVCILYGIHAYLVPHLRRPKERPDITLPHAQRGSDPRLRDTLYSVPSPNFLDPRNSIAESDLRSSRWSTNLQDLSCPVSPVSASLPRSPVMSFRTPFGQGHTPRTSSRARAEVSPSKHASRGPPKGPMAEHTIWHTRQTKSDSTDTSKRQDWQKKMQSTRRRSKSDSQLVTRGSLLAQSHAALYRQSGHYGPRSSTVSTFSNATPNSITGGNQPGEDRPTPACASAITIQQYLLMGIRPGESKD